MKQKIIGKSRISEAIRKFIQKASRYNWSILLIGETGVGKEITARIIHQLSPRRYGPFIAINCANIPDSLAESELFGHAKGAFTNAFVKRVGLFEKASGGTIFLDEVAELPFHTQAKLLRVLEEKEVRRLGDNVGRPVNTRFIFATNKNLKEEVKKGKFRRDLYYRINILKLKIPPLRKRKEDIPLFAEYIIQNANNEYGENKRLSARAFAKLLEYSFPGNIRELENILRKAYAMEKEKEIGAKDIFFEEEEEEEEEEEDRTNMLYQEMVVKGKSFWEVIHRPFLKRELNRREVNAVISLGLKQTSGSYKKLLPLFHIGQDEKDYKRFMKVINTHKLL